MKNDSKKVAAFDELPSAEEVNYLVASHSEVIYLCFEIESHVSALTVSLHV